MHPTTYATLPLALTLVACNQATPTGDPDANPPPTAIDAATAAPGDVAVAERAIARVLDDWHAAAARADEDAYFSHFAPNAVFLGTDATERWTLADFRAYAHPHFARGKAWAFKSVRRVVTVDSSGRIAWFDEDLETQGLGPARGSGVMLRGAEGAWKIAQYNLAITVPNERFVEVKELLASPRAPAAASTAPPSATTSASASANASAGSPLKK